jgi:DNA-binding beta-propeller fold protein YncE
VQPKAVGSDPTWCSLLPNHPLVSRVETWRGRSRDTSSSSGSFGGAAAWSVPRADGGNGSEDIAVSADTNSVYVTNAVDNTVSQYNIDRRTGALSPKTIATIATGLGPIGIALRPQP